MSDIVLFVVFPYLAMVLAVLGGVYRYYADRFSYSSLSSQFLENRQLFWGSVPWHYGIVSVLLAHILAGVFPGFWASLVGNTVRLYAMEITGLALGLLTFIGISLLIIRRMADPKVFAVTTVMDWVLLTDLLIQVGLGVYIAFSYRWGSVWYLSTAVPWLGSLVRLHPDVRHIVPLPLLVKLHFLNAFVVIALFPLTRLVHIFTVPLSYLWRPYQVVVWNKRAGVEGKP